MPIYYFRWMVLPELFVQTPSSARSSVGPTLGVLLMKTAKRIAIVAGCFLTIANCHAGDGWISVGKAPSSEGGGTSLALGTKMSPNFGLQFGVIFNSDFSNTDVLNYPVPHSNYQTLGTKRTGNGLGLDALYFISADSTFRPYVGIGIYTSERKEIARSNVTGWYYNQGDKSKVQVAGELGLQAVTSGGILFGAGYHSLRGANISLGKTF
jgi:hypothetical protein